MFTLSLTRYSDFDSIVRWEPLKLLRIKLPCANVWCKPAHKENGGNPIAEGVNFIDWSWFCSALCCYAFYSVRSNFKNSLSHKTWSHFLFAQHLEAHLMLGLWWACLRYDNFSLMLKTEESISEIDSHHILQDASQLWSCY